MAPEAWIKKWLTVISSKTVMELRGIPCLTLEEAAPNKKAICVSRSFSKDVYSLDSLNGYISSYVARAAEKLRGQKSVCQYLQAFIWTNPHNGLPKYYGIDGIDLTPPTADTSQLIRAATGLLKRVYRPEFSYKKAGVILSGLGVEKFKQEDLFNEPYQDSRRQTLMNVVDKYNLDVNSGKLFWAAEGTSRAAWQMRQYHRSPRYTTRWDELLKVKTG